MNLKSNDITSTVLSLIAIPIALITMTMLIHGLKKVKLSRIETILTTVSTITMFAYATFGHSHWGSWGIVTFVIGLVSFIAVELSQRNQIRIKNDMHRKQQT
jgi:hypothetical protein